MRRVVFLCFDFICNFFLLSPFRDQKRLERKTFFFFARFLVYFVQLSLYRWGRGRARGWRDAAYPTKKGRQGRLSLGSGAFRRSAERLQGVSRNPPAAAAPNKTPPAKETHQRPRFRENADHDQKPAREAPQTTTEYKLYVFFIRKQEAEQERKTRKSFLVFLPFLLSRSRSNLFPPRSLDQNSFLSLSLFLSLSGSLSLQGKKNAGVVL